eukprot:CAMPEP_0168501532 /NCGR_PEP_ID=MMETSP0228-20121227/74853_1 /TAXON_ID=133427 /ORGANISM="Protoceratium reticulatum, Strain CCCM 535 (=CCMP 1889)" /LENGTH=61 /DNA_ID=CAMNT_0008518489 /DNA_START=75 /DNA_END=261 /DNA_ORIENTATION=-
MSCSMTLAPVNHKHDAICRLQAVQEWALAKGGPKVVADGRAKVVAKLIQGEGAKPDPVHDS